MRDIGAIVRLLSARLRPRVCEPNSAQLLSFIRYCSNVADPSCDRAERNGSSRDSALFAEWFRCHSSLFITAASIDTPTPSSAVASPRRSRDLWSLEPGRPDRIVFAAIAGGPSTRCARSVTRSRGAWQGGEAALTF
jgi:hypothetical protein